MNAPQCLCSTCQKNIPENSKAVFCNNCEFWVHIKCNNISVSEYKKLQNEGHDVPWFCLRCTMVMFPFSQLENEELSNLFNFDFPSWVDSAPSFEITSGLINLPNLDGYDIDEHLPSNVNSSYHTLQDLSALEHSGNDLSLFHLNVRLEVSHFIWMSLFQLLQL